MYCSQKHADARCNFFLVKPAVRQGETERLGGGVLPEIESHTPKSLQFDLYACAVIESELGGPSAVGRLLSGRNVVGEPYAGRAEGPDPAPFFGAVSQEIVSALVDCHALLYGCTLIEEAHSRPHIVA